MKNRNSPKVSSGGPARSPSPQTSSRGLVSPPLGAPAASAVSFAVVTGALKQHHDCAKEAFLRDRQALNSPTLNPEASPQSRLTEPHTVNAQIGSVVDATTRALKRGRKGDDDDNDDNCRRCDPGEQRSDSAWPVPAPPAGTADGGLVMRRCRG